MGDDYQVRKDIDRLIRSVYSLEGNNLRLVSFEDDSELLPFQTIDAILDYYNLKNVEQLIEEIEAGDIDLTRYYTKEQINTLLLTYQPLLRSGENIKTINNQSILGGGDLDIGGGSIDIATSWGDPTSDEKVPSEKLVKDSLDEKVDYDELHNLDINLTTLELVPKNTNPNGVICFDDLQNKYIEKSNTTGLVKNDGTIDTTQYLSSLPSHNHDDRYYTESEVDSALNGKQAKLISGTNIKTINNQSLLGSGNIDIQGGGGSVIGTGSFSINNQGHLIVELPNAVDNPYFINSNGHLIYDTSNTHNGE